MDPKNPNTSNGIFTTEDQISENTSNQRLSAIEDGIIPLLAADNRQSSSMAEIATTAGEEEFCDHVHHSNRAPWLRALVLGANDGLVSVAALLMGNTSVPMENGAGDMSEAMIILDMSPDLDLDL
ncbi:hypothetical protein Ndes2526B_g04696 [Nannochloris sp. 'desiccata']